jgi:hypothetical protein
MLTATTSFDTIDVTDGIADVYISSHTDAVKRILAASAASSCRPAHELVSFPASMSCSAALAALHNAKIHGAPVYEELPVKPEDSAIHDVRRGDAMFLRDSCATCLSSDWRRLCVCSKALLLWIIDVGLGSLMCVIYASLR